MIGFVRVTGRETSRHSAGKRAGRLVLAAAVVAAAASSAAITSAAVAAPRQGTAAGRQAAGTGGQGTKALVVMERTRPGFGKILVTLSGRALYVLPHGSCAGSCLAIWPRLVMPAGATVPGGASCLGTRSFGSSGRLQVTYRKRRLYTFVSDHGRSVNGNSVDGFAVARVVTCTAPAPAPSPVPSSSPTGSW